MTNKNTQNLIEIKKDMKSKKPNFARRNYNTKPRISNGWRKPKGLQNKMRLNKKGYSRCVDSGYGSPVEIRNIDLKSGLFPILISTEKDLDKIDVKTQGIVIASTVGSRKKLNLIKLAKEKNIILLQDVDKITSRINALLENKKEKKKILVERKKKRLAKDKKSVETKKKKEETQSEIGSRANAQETEKPDSNNKKEKVSDDKNDDKVEVKKTETKSDDKKEEKPKLDTKKE